MGKCEGCKWFELLEDEGNDFGDGECHRYPKASSNQQETSGTVTELFLYPTVLSNFDWCGEFEVKDAAN
jgi:hypothetical protein